MSDLKVSPHDLYCWQDEGAWHIGVAMKVKPFVCIEMRTVSIGEKCDEWCVLIRHCHTGELEWVPESKLRPYPESNIEEPTK